MMRFMDWKNIIAEIQRHGQMTQSQIAAEVECGQATISDLANGGTKQPSYSLGAALLKVLDRARKQSELSRQDGAPEVHCAPAHEVEQGA